MIVVAGEALVDLFVGAATPHGVALDARCGGSPFNVAVGLARLGQPVAFVGAISRDALGERLLRALADDGVALDGVQRVDAPTPIAVVGIGAGGAPSYAFHAGAERRLAAPAWPAGARALHVGSYAMVVEPVATALRALVDAPQRSGALACDVNVRLAVEPDVARWREALEWLLPRVQLLKASGDDLACLGFDGAAATAAGWLARGVSLVVVTHGAGGASAWTRTAQARVAAAPTPVVDTVGAGDAFHAALLAWLADHDRLGAAALAALDAASLEAALAYASHAAAIVCGRRGADLPRREELMR